MEKKQTFKDIGVDDDIVSALNDAGISHPREIQLNSIPLALEGKDIIGRSQTGSGKTLAFGVPIVQELKKSTTKGVKALILCPTRELAKQVSEVIEMLSANTDLHAATIYGGVDYEPQYESLGKANIIIGTPGRIIDHVKRGTLDLGSLEFFVLDEADRMLDMGFIDDINYIVGKSPEHKQNFFFSATMPMPARDLAESFMHDPVMIKSKDVFVDNERLKEYYVDVPALHKADMCAEVLRREKPKLALIFVNTRTFSDALANYLSTQGFNARSLHGGHSQTKREKIVDDFENEKSTVLVATDVAARGLDINNITHVINFEVPKDEQDYTHRIGRTARAGRSGVAITLLDEEEHRLFSRIEGDSQRDIQKYVIDYKTKKHYLLPRRSSNNRNRRFKGNNSGHKRRRA